MMACAPFVLAGCAATRADGVQASAEANDPLESYNRAMFAVNNGIDTVFLEPVARGYRAIVPKFVRTGVRNFLDNLHSPVNIANQVLQGDIEGAASDTSRMVINTTVGIGGVFDIAKETGLKRESEDFGQTMGSWGVGSGPYFVLPVVGPSSIRDTVGMVVDSYADPVRLYLHNTDNDEWYYARLGAIAVDRREELLDVLEDLQKNSLDYYAAVRSAYVQRRQALIDDQEPGTSSGPAIPDYAAGEDE